MRHVKVLPMCPERTVVSCVGPRRRIPRNPWSEVISPLDLMEKFSSGLIEAMTEKSIKRIIVVSAAGVGSSFSAMHPFIRLVFGHSNIGLGYLDLGKMEENLEKSSLDWTAVRPVTLTPGRLTGNERICDRFGLTSLISRSDVAHFLLKCVESPDSIPTRSPMICG